MQIILDFIYKILVLFKLDHRTWIVKTLLLAGITLITQSIWGVLVEQYITKHFQYEIPDLTVHGWVMVTFSLLVFMLNRHDLLSLSTWHTH